MSAERPTERTLGELLSAALRPPEGKSLGWLMREVKRYDPKARVLAHDWHLHAGFNGYYKAPKLGGMAGR